MTTRKTVCCAGLLFSALALAQPIPVYRDQEDYCYHNPDMPTCKKMTPLTPDQINGYLYKPNKTDAPAPSAPRVVKPIQTAPTRATATRSADWPSTRSQRTKESSPSLVQVGELDWRFTHPHPDALIGMDIESLVGSELMRALLRDWAGKLGATPQEQDKMLSGMADVKRILISIYSRDMLAMMVGNVRNVPEGVQAGGLRFTRLAEDVVLMGSEAGTSAALTRLKLPPLAGSRHEEAEVMAKTYDFWIWGRPERLTGASIPASGETTVTKMKLGVSFRDNFNLQMILDTTSPANATHLLESMQKGAPRGMLGAVEGNSVRYAMVLDRDAALQRFAGFMTDSVGKQFAPLIAAARQMSARQAAAARPTAGKIVIDGLDDGPKELPLGQRQ